MGYTKEFRRQYAVHLSVIQWGHRLVLACLVGSVLWGTVAWFTGSVWAFRDAAVLTVVLLPVAVLCNVSTRVLNGATDTIIDCEAALHQARNRDSP